MLQKFRTFLKYWRDPTVSKQFVVKYALGQVLARLGIGRFIPFSTPHYSLYLTKSPVALVLFGNPGYGRDEENFLKNVLQSGDVVVDVGANIGTFSLRAAAEVGARGHVYAFEGNPKTAQIMKRNVQLNKLNNITVVASAIGDKNKEVHFSAGDNDDVDSVTEEKSGIIVPMLRLDDFELLKQVPKIRVMNIDVEGFELFVLHGGEKTIMKTEQVIFEAYAPHCLRAGYRLDELLRWFEAHDFYLCDLITRKKIDANWTGMKEVRNVLATRR